MRGLAAFLIATSMLACSSSPDFCSQFEPVVSKQESDISSCNVDGGNATAALAVVGAEFPFSNTQACESQIPGCNAADVTQLNNELTCLKALPTFDCSILDQDPDAGLAAFAASVQGCEAANLSPTCRSSADGGPGCGVELHTANNVLSQPLQLQDQTPVTDCLGIGDTHYLSVTAPAQPLAGGYYQVQVNGITTNVEGRLEIKLADTSGTPANRADYFVETPSTFFLALQPSVTFLIEVTSDSTLPLGYTITPTWVPIADQYKPDRIMSEAATLTLGTPTSGQTCGSGAGQGCSYMWAGQVTATPVAPQINGDFDDWFKVDVPGPGTVSVQLIQFPHDFAPAADFTDLTGTPIAPQTGSTNSSVDGASLNYTVLVNSAGSFFVHVYPFQVDTLHFSTYSLPPLQAAPVLPAHFTSPYALTVSFN